MKRKGREVGGVGKWTDLAKVKAKGLGTTK